MKIFPLSILGKFVLILIAIVLGLIYRGMSHPLLMKKIERKELPWISLFKRCKEGDECHGKKQPEKK